MKKVIFILSCLILTGCIGPIKSVKIDIHQYERDLLIYAIREGIKLIPVDEYEYKNKLVTFTMKKKYPKISNFFT